MYILYARWVLYGLCGKTRWVLYGLMGGAKMPTELRPPPLQDLLKKRVSFVGTTLRSRSHAYRTDLVQSFTDNELRHFQDPNGYQVNVFGEFDLADVEEAHKVMQGNQNAGKIVLIVGSD
eukprot:GHVS01064131.1.p1 GENE.GHVS01064131.1~~GHVS01064131.1.p1  ORF type:complete len:120 (-),score=16.29 GHVS01064131.1:399-758(-)